MTSLSQLSAASSRPPVRARLGERLVEKGYLTADRLNEVLRDQHLSGDVRLLGEILVEEGICSPEQVLEALADEFNVPFVRLNGQLFDPKVFESLPREFIEQNDVLPLFRVRDTLTVAVADPTNVFVLDEARQLAGCHVQFVVATARDIRRMIQTYMPASGVYVIDDILEDVTEGAVEWIEQTIEDIADVTEEADLSPVIKLVNYVIFHAVKQGASDIHIEPNDRQLLVRYRIDGVLQSALELPLQLAPAVASRIKIMAQLDISERRLPQDGRIRVLMEGHPVDLRVSTLANIHGEKVVIRILDQRNVNRSLEELNFRAPILEGLRRHAAAPNGIVLVTGPTGSGKSTTLYAVLRSIASIERNICPVEDPVEFRLPLVNQFQVNERIGLGFADVLRSLLRQDPDVILVGEIRDRETARVAVQAALTGHLVFSTLHTNDACSTVTRLIDMGVEGYLLAAALNMVLAQRLCRRLCPRCREAIAPNRLIRLELERMGIGGREVYQARGCKRCREMGFSGRIAIHEMLEVTDELREIITARPQLAHLRAYARDSGMVPLRYDGLLKVCEGLTTFEQVLQASPEGWTPRTAMRQHAAQHDGAAAERS
ncbi:MAG: type II/IV secretion system protein [Planctomycetota bacterium]|nr:MAG: type II/IV secretion system protein [Planctomycetota bacterium]